jgi:hypothetical protein
MNDQKESGYIELVNEFRARIVTIEAERDEYREQADNYAAVIREHEKRIAELDAQLAKMSHTPDGVLVVLGETTLYVRAHGWNEHGKVDGFDKGNDGEIIVYGYWSDPAGGRYRGQRNLSDCYGSEAALIESEGV